MTDDTLSERSPLKRTEPEQIEIPSVHHARLVAEKGRCPLCIFDLETTGLNAAEDHIVSIGAVRVEHFDEGPRITQEFEALIAFGDERMLDPLVADLIGFDPAEWRQKACPLDLALRAFFPVWSRARGLAGWNVSFDRGFLDAACRSLGWQTPPLRSVDLMAFAWPLLVARDVESMKLETVAKHLGVLAPDERQKHSALSDCKLTFDIYRTLVLGEAP